MTQIAQPLRPVRAAQYLRMSTEEQCYSLDHQAHALELFAAGEGFEIVRSYADPGRSGLTLQQRPGLRGLLQDIEEGGADFDAVLVYDISRWGRFQDADESAFYEFRCRRGGVQVVYCAEPFYAQQTPLAAVFKAMKRVMAAEFSRELSSKIAHAKRRLSARGFWQGGEAAYGLQRQVISAEGVLKGLLRAGERKPLITDRIILVPGAPEEVADVREVFRLYCDALMTRAKIAAHMRQRSERRGRGGPWTASNVRIILMDEKYVGHYVYGRFTTLLRTPRRMTSEVDQVRVEDAFEAIIDQSIFDKAQRIRWARSGAMPRERALERLRVLAKRHGKLTNEIIAVDPETPSPYFYVRRFGTLLEAYRQAGWTPPRDYTPQVLANRSRAERYWRERRASSASDEAGWS